MPFVYDNKPYERVGSTTTVMSPDEYARLLFERNHARHRWENQPAEGVRLEDLDHEEILRRSPPPVRLCTGPDLLREHETSSSSGSDERDAIGAGWVAIVSDDADDAVRAAAQELAGT